MRLSTQFVTREGVTIPEGPFPKDAHIRFEHAMQATPFPTPLRQKPFRDGPPPPPGSPRNRRVGERARNRKQHEAE